MGAYRQINETLQQEYNEQSPTLKSKLIAWRAAGPIVRIERPSNLARARELGYKTKQGVMLARVRVRKGLSKREKARKGRKPSKNGRFFAMEKSLKAIAEERAARKFINCEVVNSYYVGEDGSNKFFETILVDRSHPAIKSDRFYSDLIGRKGRSFRGLTHAGRDHRNFAQ